MGVSCAVLEKDAERMLAFHTISQLGFILAAPEVGVAHGLFKSSLFLSAGALPSRNFKELQQKHIDTTIWIALVIASLSISGFSLLSGFGSKVLSMKNMLPWQAISMNVAAVGTAISFAKFIFLSHASQKGYTVKPGFCPAVTLLLGGLIAGSVIYFQAYNITDIIKAIATIGVGWLAYTCIFKQLAVYVPRVLEEFDHLIGAMSLILILLFWMALA